MSKQLSCPTCVLFIYSYELRAFPVIAMAAPGDPDRASAASVWPPMLLPNMIRPKPSNTITPAGTQQLWAAADTCHQVILHPFAYCAPERGR